MNFGPGIIGRRAKECAEGRAPLVSFQQWEQAARRMLPSYAFDYAAGGAGSEATIRANRSSFERWRIVPRLLKGVANRNLSVELFGHTYPFPVGLAPTASQALFHRLGELAAAKAAAALGILYILSMESTYPIENVAATGARRWFQLYPGQDQDVMRSLVSRAERSGYSAIVLTPDRPEIGWRERNVGNCLPRYIAGYELGNLRSDPVVRKKYGTALPPQISLSLVTNPFASLSDFRFVRSLTTLPLIVKGVLHPADADMLVGHGADGIIVSNHGGRHMDGAVAALDALPAVVDAVDGRVPVLFDSGIRHGADIVKALALGARMVFIGRPFLYGLAVNGEDGVRTVLENMLADFDLNLGISGVRDVNDVNRSMLVPAVRM